MRLLLAGLCVFAALLVAVGLLGEGGLERLGPLGPLVLAATFLVAVVAALWGFNRKGSASRPETLERQIRELEEGGLLEDTSFRATRAFAVEELEDEGLHYFLELDDGQVLFLSGQYLYDYGPEIFPCTELTVRRHKQEGFVVDLVCRGDVLEAECVAEPFSTGEWEGGEVPQDGELLRGKSYADVKALRIDSSP